MLEARSRGATGEELLRVGHAVAAREGILTPPPPFPRVGGGGGGAGEGGEGYPFPAELAGGGGGGGGGAGGLLGAPRGGGGRNNEGNAGSLAIGLMLGSLFGVIALFFTLGNNYTRLFRIGVIVGVALNMVTSIYSDVTAREAGGDGSDGGGGGSGSGPRWPAPGDSPWAAAVGPPLPPRK